MRKLYVLLMAAICFGSVTAACSSDTTVLTGNTQAEGITVSGEGSVFGQPDIALVTLGVQADADSVGAARTQAAGSMNAMLDALKSGGVDEKDIQTTQFSVDPRYDYSNNKQTLIGFTVNNIVTVKIRDIDKTGDLVDGAITAGGDQARVQSLQFTIDDPASLRNEARQKAMTDARGRAETLAGAANAAVGAPRSITEGAQVTPITFGAADLARQVAAPETPLQTGLMEVTVQVTVVYGLE